MWIIPKPPPKIHDTEATRLSRLFWDNLSRFFTKSLKTLGKKHFQTSPKRAETFSSDAFSAPEAPRVPPNPYARCTATRPWTVNPPHSAIPLGVTRAASGTERAAGQRPSSCAAPASLLAHPAGNRSRRRERDAFRQKPGESLGEAASRARRHKRSLPGAARRRHLRR